MTSFNITIPNVTNIDSLVTHGNELTEGYAMTSILFLVFIGVIIMGKGSKTSLSISALVTLFLSFIAQSLGWVNEQVTLVWLTALVLSFIYIVIK